MPQSIHGYGRGMMGGKVKRGGDDGMLGKNA
jgi:hypothetical protein